MARPFEGGERDGAVLLLQDIIGQYLNGPVVSTVNAALIHHLKIAHGYPPGACMKMIVELEVAALRAVADRLEEEGAKFMADKADQLQGR
jgi:hypothetical protein